MIEPAKKDYVMDRQFVDSFFISGIGLLCNLKDFCNILLV